MTYEFQKKCLILMRNLSFLLLEQFIRLEGMVAMGTGGSGSLASCCRAVGKVCQGFKLCSVV